MTQAGTHDVLNELTAIDATALVYDEQGNLTDDGTKLYVWDVTGRLERVREKATGDPIAWFSYDSYGRRITKYSIATGEDEDFYYDGWHVIEAYATNGGATSLSERNVWGLYLDETVVRTSFPDGKDYYPVLNPIYSPLRIYDGSANLVARAKYTPYGKPTLLDSAGDPTTLDYPHLFTGQRYDAATELCYYKNRYYVPDLGRFGSRDRNGRFSAPNLYAYSMSRPTSELDPYGLESVSSAKAKCPGGTWRGFFTSGGAFEWSAVYGRAWYAGTLTCAEEHKWGRREYWCPPAEGAFCTEPVYKKARCQIKGECTSWGVSAGVDLSAWIVYEAKGAATGAGLGGESWTLNLEGGLFLNLSIAAGPSGGSFEVGGGVGVGIFQYTGCDTEVVGCEYVDPGRVDYTCRQAVYIRGGMPPVQYRDVKTED